MALSLPLRKILTEPSIPREHSVIVYKDSGNVYAKDENGGIICQNSPTSCLQEAVNYLQQFRGGRILVKQGTYYPTSGVDIPDGINLLIEGEGNNTVFKYTNQFQLFRHLPNSPTWTSTLIFRNFKIDRSGSGTNNVDVLVIYYAKFLMFDGIELVDDWRNAHGDAGLVGYNNIVAIAQNNRIFNKSYGIWLFGHISVMRNNYVKNTAKVGIGGAGLLNNFNVPPGYEAGGLIIIESNICIDCGRTDEAVAVDYLSGSPVIESLGIIRDNLIMSKDYSMWTPIAAIYASDVIIEGNKVYGKVSAPIIYMNTDKTIRNIIIRSNIFKIEANSSYIRPTILSDTVVFENNVLEIKSNLNQNVSSQVSITSKHLIFKNNRIIIKYPTDYYTGYIINISPVGDEFVAYIKDNYFDAPVNPSLQSAIIIYPNATETVAYVKFMRNLIKSATFTRSFLGLSGTVNATYYATVRDNEVVGSLDKSVRLWNDAQNTYAVIDTDVAVRQLSRASYKYAKSNSGTATFSGNGTATQFTIPHNLVSKPNKVLVTPASANAAGSFYVTADDTHIYINYLTPPPTGTNNIVLNWYAEI